jgi:hypothetical protein
VSVCTFSLKQCFYDYAQFTHSRDRQRSLMATEDPRSEDERLVAMDVTMNAAASAKAATADTETLLADGGGVIMTGAAVVDLSGWCIRRKVVLFLHIGVSAARWCCSYILVYPPQGGVVPAYWCIHRKVVLFLHIGVSAARWCCSYILGMSVLLLLVEIFLWLVLKLKVKVVLAWNTVLGMPP